MASTKKIEEAAADKELDCGGHEGRASEGVDLDDFEAELVKVAVLKLAGRRIEELLAGDELDGIVHAALCACASALKEANDKATRSRKKLERQMKR